MVAIDEEKVDGLLQKRRNPGTSRRRVRVAANEMDFLLLSGERPEERSPCARIPTPELSSVHIHGHERCACGSHTREKEESSSVKSPELEHRMRPRDCEALEQRHHLFTDLARTRSYGAVVEPSNEIVGRLDLHRRVLKEAPSASRLQRIRSTAQQTHSGGDHDNESRERGPARRI